MRKFTNQRGLAVLEVVIVAAIVAIFATAAVPRMARIYDKVQLDYEMKYLYSTLNLARSIGKNSEGSISPSLYVFKDKYYIAKDTLHIHEHRLSDGIELNCSIGFRSTLDYIFFRANNVVLYGKSYYSGKRLVAPTFSSGYILLKSRYGSAKIVFNSVDRWHGEYDK